MPAGNLRLHEFYRLTTAVVCDKLRTMKRICRLVSHVRVVAAAVAAVLIVGCSQPLLPPARVPVAERRSLPDEQLLALLKQDWELLKKSQLTEAQRAEVVARYNNNCYLLMRRYRHDIKKALSENDHNYMPQGVVLMMTSASV